MKNRAEMEFLQGEFISPGTENALIYAWVWNDEINREIIDEQLAQFKEAGIEFIYILPLPVKFRPITMQTNLKPDYLSDEFFELVRYTLKKTRELGMKMWLYDEGGWPSGGACGNTLAENPKARETLLYKRDICLKAGEKYEASSDAVSAFCKKERVEDGFVAKDDVSIAEYYLSKVQEERVNDPNRVDSTNKSVIDTFLNNTYEKYKEGLGEDFGEISAMFTDEPSVAMWLIPEGFFELFLEKYGYDARDYIYCIYDKTLAVTEKEQLARVHYGRILGDLFYTNFCKNIADWCRKNNTFFTGHLDVDHVPFGASLHGYFSHLRCLSEFDIPGVDVIWHQIHFPKDGGAVVSEGTPFFPRLASSAAHQTGKNLSVTESLGVYGDAITPDEFRYVLNYQAVRGINVFNIMLTAASPKKMYSMIERPVFSASKPGFYNMKHINTYYKRLSYLLRLGKPQIDTALYIPCADFWASEELSKKASDSYIEKGNKLERSGVDFDIVDDYAILSAEATCDGLKVGEMVYKNIIVPDCKFVPQEVKDKISPYVKEIEKDATESEMRFMKRKLDSGMIHFIFNEDADAKEISINVTNGYRLDAVNGEISRLVSDKVLIESGDIAVIYETDKEVETVGCEEEYTVELKGFEPISARRFNLSAEGISMEDAPFDVVPSMEFSGEITYRTSYKLPCAPKADERYAIAFSETEVSARISIDGKAVATVGLTPMSAVISGACLNESGTIEITVANTAGNEIVKKEELIKSLPSGVAGPYQDMCLQYEKNAGMLKFGSVKLVKLKEEKTAL